MTAKKTQALLEMMTVIYSEINIFTYGGLLDYNNHSPSVFPRKGQSCDYREKINQGGRETSPGDTLLYR